MTIHVNGRARTVPADLSIAGLLDALEMRPEVVHIQLNGEPVPRDRFNSITLKEGDEVDIVMSMGGGCSGWGRCP